MTRRDPVSTARAEPTEVVWFLFKALWRLIRFGLQVLRFLGKVATDGTRADAVSTRPVGTPAADAAVGLLIDVSGSMRQSIRNETLIDVNRFQSVLSAVDELARRAAAIAKARGEGRDDSLLVFAYGFGFTFGSGVADLLSLLKLLGYGDAVEQEGAGAEAPADAELATSDPYRYLQTLAEEHRREGWAHWMTESLDRQSAANVAANFVRHRELPRALEEVLPDLSHEEIAYLLAVETSMQGGVVHRARGGRALARDRSGSFGAARKTTRAGGPKEMRRKVAVAQRILDTLSSTVLDRSALLELLLDPEIRELSGRVVDDLVRDRLAEVGDTTVTFGDLAELVRESGGTGTRDARAVIYGRTPMCEALRMAEWRFGRLLGPHTQSGGATSILVIVSDGEPTDGDPRAIVERIRARGIIVVSCYVTDRDVQAPRALVGQPADDWSEGARLMFDCASVAAGATRQTQYLVDHGWTASDDARLFAQVNHSAILSEFLQSAIG